MTGRSRFAAYQRRKCLIFANFPNKTSMEWPFDSDGIAIKRICIYCINEAFLKKEVMKSGKRRKCSYCHGTAKTFSVGELAEKVEKAFENFYVRTSDEPTDWDYYLNKELGEMWVREGEPVAEVIEEAAGIPSEAALDVHKLLDGKHSEYDPDNGFEETEFDDDSQYTLKKLTDDYWQSLWDQFEQSLKSENRLFNSRAREILKTIFTDLQRLKTNQGNPVLIEGGPGTDIPLLYRARILMSDAELQMALANPDLQLGPPPAQSASAGRMNGRGISVFYGADQPDVAVSEVRPPVGSRVAVAPFDFIRAVRLLDLEALESIVDSGSIFDPKELMMRQKSVFLRNLTSRLTTPVMPDDEPLEYLPTQAIADFLADEIEPKIDGIRFPSVQSGRQGKNVVLFHGSSKVERLQRPPGTKVSVGLKFESDEDEISVDYLISEELAANPAETTSDAVGPIDNLTAQATLRINMGKIDIHQINAISFIKEIDHVSRYIRDPNDDRFTFESVFGER